jgi:uncharacterized membrane protein
MNPAIYTILAACLAASVAAAQPPQYRLIDLGAVIATDINDAAQVVGAVTASQQAARLRATGAQSLPPLPGGYFSRANGSNLLAEVVGYSSTGAYGLQTHATQWDRNGNPTDLGTLGSTNLFSAATDNNLTDTISGYADDATGERVVPVVWVGGVALELDTLGGLAGYADTINDYGVVVGESQALSGEWHATLWDIDGIPRDLHPEGLGGSSRARAINRYGVVVGEGVMANIQYGFLWSEMVGFMRLPARPGDVGNAASGINASGTVVGYSLPPNTGTFPPPVEVGVLWHHGVPYRLTDLIPAPHDGWQLTRPVGISRGGSIAGTGTYQGQRRSWLLVPCRGRKCYDS